MSTILEITNANKSLTSLMIAMKASGLEEVLNGKGPFTIFAPVNIAFYNLEKESLEDLVKPVNKQRLSDIMTFHMIPGKNLVTDLSNGQKLKTVNGQELSVVVTNDEVRINGAKVLAQNMQGSNGVVHSIDAVNMPA